MQGLRSNSAHFWALNKAGRGGATTSDFHLWASQKAGFRHPILILSPLSLGIPENAGVM